MTLTTLYIFIIFALFWAGSVLAFAWYESRPKRRIDRGLPGIAEQARRRHRDRR